MTRPKLHTNLCATPSRAEHNRRRRVVHPLRTFAVLAVAGGAIASSAALAPQRLTPRVAAAAGCAPAPPRVVFPQRSPFRGSGPGALLWRAAPPGRCGASSPATLTLAPILGSDTVGTPRPLLAGVTDLQAAGTTRGQVLAAVRRQEAGAQAPASALIEGRADGPFSAAHSLDGAVGPMASATGYLGDVALAWVRDTGPAARPPVRRLALAVQRHFAAAPVVRGLYPLGGDGADSLRVALDYRSDALLTWAASGRIHARYVPASGQPGPVQTLGDGGASPALEALVSDDGRAIVAWVSQHAGAAARPASAYVYLSISGPRVRFSAPQLIERFHEPTVSPLPSSALALARLSTESVVLAWTGLGSAGHYVVRSADVGLGGLGAVTVVSDPTADALLGALAPGPRADAVVVWTVPVGIGTLLRRSVAGRRLIPSFRDSRLGPLMTLTTVGPYDEPAVAVDPGSDRAVAAWRANDQPSGVRSALLDPRVASPAVRR